MGPLRNILITGGSGYLGGDILAQLGQAELPPHGRTYALVRTEEQGRAVKTYGAEALAFDVTDGAAVEKNVVDNNISIVFFLISAMSSHAQKLFIRALGKVRQATGLDVHFLHVSDFTGVATSGAKIFSDLAGAPTGSPLLDTDKRLYDIQKAQKPPYPLMEKAVETNGAVIDEAEAHGVRSYIFAPCIVYGHGRGFGNPISIQTVAIVKAAKAARRVYRVDTHTPTWPVCHVADTTGLYLALLGKMVAEDPIDHGRDGYYLASPGSVAWDDIYASMASALARRGVVDSDEVLLADDDALEAMAQGLKCPKEMVRIHLGGECAFTAKHGEALGWKPRHGPQHILEAADAEVELILKHL